MTKPILGLCETIDDLALLQNELRANEDCWLLDTSRQDKIACQRDTQTIFLRVAATAQTPGIPTASVHASRDSKVSIKFPRTMAWLADVLHPLGGEPGRAMLVRLKPSGQIFRHIDRGDYYQVRHRFHVMLNAPEGCWLECGGERWATRTGQIIWFDNKCPYEEGNPSGEWSVRMIVNILPHARPPIPSRFKNFALMKAGIDVGPMLEEIDGQPELWDADTRRQTNVQVQRETSSIPLRGALKPIPDGVNQNNWHPSRRTPYADRCPRIYSWVEQFVNELGGDLPGSASFGSTRMAGFTRTSTKVIITRSATATTSSSAVPGERDEFRRRGGRLPRRGTVVVQQQGRSRCLQPVRGGADSRHLRRASLKADGGARAWPRSGHPRPDHASDVRADLDVERLRPGHRGPTRWYRSARRGQHTRRPVGRRPCDPRRRDAGARRAVAPGAGNGRRPGGAPRLGAPGGIRLVTGSDYWAGLCQVLALLRQQPSTTAANELMLSLGGRPRELPLADPSRMAATGIPLRRGLFGYEIRLVRDPALIVLISPFDFVASNRSFIKILKQFDWALGLDGGRRPSGQRQSSASLKPCASGSTSGETTPPWCRSSAGPGWWPLEEVTLDSRGDASRTPRRLSHPLGASRRADGLPVPPEQRLRRPDPQQRHPAMDGHRCLIRVWSGADRTNCCIWSVRTSTTT